MVCCVASPSALPLIAEAVRAGAAPQLRCVVVLAARGEEGEAAQDEALRAAPPMAGVQLAAYHAVVARGSVARCTYSGFGFGADCAAHHDVHDSDDDIYTLMYSSGTTGGAPKAIATPKKTWRKTNCNPGKARPHSLAGGPLRPRGAPRPPA